MRPLDPRLLHHASAARRHILLTVLLGTLTAGLAIAQAVLLAHLIARAARAGEGLSHLAVPLAWLTAVLLVRTVIAWAQDRYGHRAATTVIAQLRQGILEKIAALGPRALEDGSGPALTTLTTRGLDCLDGYLVRYLPQLVLTATVTPAVLVAIWWHDTLSGLTVLLTLPLVPLFLALVGLATQAAADRRLRSLQRLGGQVLDLLAGLPTLRALGREHGQAALVRRAGDDYRRATMQTLRSAFLSALVLESLTTLSVALVAVGIGLRMVHGDIDLRTGLAVIILAPEAYLPLRMLGVQYHASVDGLAASEAALEILDRPVPAPGTVQAPDLRRTTVRFDGVTVVHPGTDRATPSGLDFDLRPGRITALAGDSGAGKTTALHVLLGLHAPTGGQVLLLPDGVVAGAGAGSPDRLVAGAALPFVAGAALSLVRVEPDSWYRQIAWVPQRPLMSPGTLAENIRLAAPGATDEELEQVADRCGLREVLADLDLGWQTPLGQGGYGLSAGQRQRLGLARALLRRAPLLVLDEPTAHLDASTEQVIIRTLQDLNDRGTTILLVAHRPSLLALAQDLVRVDATRIAPTPDSAT
ncbi:MAG: ATP-binding cassette, subfamily bacterial CydD, partial [Actinomycetota bacterium]|nr:ATP-binding cassette, subfamily bacterial CydD [Actinomycetota bacterium]